jgi:NAD-dependent deacetylase
LSEEKTMLSFQDQLQDAVELLQEARQIVVLTGAGISTESGIPDFRSPGSIWQRQPPVSYHAFLADAQARRRYWQTRAQMLGQVQAARPNAAHRALVELERRQRLLGLLTQNFDGLHQDAGHDPARVLELHGTSREAACTLCGVRSSMELLQQRIEDGEIDPQCELCGGYLKAATILFGQSLAPEVLSQARAWCEECDLFLVVGSSLKVQPAANFPRVAVRREVPLIIVNLLPTPLDSYADVVLQEKAGLVLPQLLTNL